MYDPAVLKDWEYRGELVLYAWEAQSLYPDPYTAVMKSPTHIGADRGPTPWYIIIEYVGLGKVSSQPMAPVSALTLKMKPSKLSAVTD